MSELTNGGSLWPANVVSEVQLATDRNSLQPADYNRHLGRRSFLTALTSIAAIGAVAEAT